MTANNYISCEPAGYQQFLPASFYCRKQEACEIGADIDAHIPDTTWLTNSPHEPLKATLADDIEVELRERYLL